MSITLSQHDSNLGSPLHELAIEDDKSSTSFGEEASLDIIKERVSNSRRFFLLGKVTKKSKFLLKFLFG